MVYKNDLLVLYSIAQKLDKVKNHVTKVLVAKVLMFFRRFNHYTP